MAARKMILSGSWYPNNPKDIHSFLEPIKKNSGEDTREGAALAALAPHAGWQFSGRLAARALSSLDAADTVVIVAGHLPSGEPIYYAAEDSFETPLGPIEADSELRDAVLSLFSASAPVSIPVSIERRDDNGVEVLLPMVRYFFPSSRLLAFRFPPDMIAFEAGKTIAAAARALGRRVSYVASTDLTHYGASFGFSPRGSGAAALTWVREHNDASFIAAALAKDVNEVLRRAREDRSACAAGAVAGALGFLSSIPASRLSASRLLDYHTSADVDSRLRDPPPSSFVGYAAVVW